MTYTTEFTLKNLYIVRCVETGYKTYVSIFEGFAGLNAAIDLLESVA